MSKTIKLVGALIFLILLNAGLFTFASISLTSFWISWVFMHIAFVILVFVFVFSIPEQKKLLFGYSESAITIYYFIVEMAAGLVLMFQFAFFPVIAFAIQVIILAAFVIAFFMVKKMNENIDREESARAADMKQFNYIVESMKDVLNQVDYNAPYKKIVEHAYDAMMGSQMRTSQEVYNIEQNILVLTNQLKQEVVVGNEEAVKECCRNIEAEIAERNKQLRLAR